MEYYFQRQVNDSHDFNIPVYILNVNKYFHCKCTYLQVEMVQFVCYSLSFKYFTIMVTNQFPFENVIWE